MVSISSKVWRSRSPLMLEAVTAGTIKVSRINSMVATNSYISIKLLYWMVAVALTWETTANTYSSSATSAEDAVKHTSGSAAGAGFGNSPVISRLINRILLHRITPTLSSSRSVSCIKTDSRLPCLADKAVDQHLRVDQLLQQHGLVLLIAR